MSGTDPRMATLRGRFVARAAKDHKALAAARAAGDCAAIRDIAHALAGAAGIFGFAEIGVAARAVDEAQDDSEAALAHLLCVLDATSRAGFPNVSSAFAVDHH